MSEIDAVRLESEVYPVVKIHAFGEIKNGGTPSSDEENWDGDIPFITPPDLNGLDSKSVASVGRTITELGLKQGSNLVENGVIISGRAPVGYVGVIVTPSAFNQGCKAICTAQNHRYVAYALTASKSNLQVLANGTTFPEISSTALANYAIPLPPLETQRHIADYLDRETAEIDAAVVDLDKYVELLEKRRQVVITQSVTRGIGSNRTRVHLRALPGSEGVMNSPTKKVPFWSLLEFINAPVESSSYGVRLEDIDSWTGRLFDNEIRDRGDSQGTPFQPGDSLFGKLRPYLAKSWLATTSGVAVGDIHVYRPKRHCEPRFLSYILRTSDFIRFAEGVSEGVKMPRSEWSKLRQYPIPLPPLETQQRIADYLDRETAEIDSLIAESTTLRDLLLKRRSALITEVVTGRKQV